MYAPGEVILPSHAHSYQRHDILMCIEQAVKLIRTMNREFLGAKCECKVNVSRAWQRQSRKVERHERGANREPRDCCFIRSRPFSGCSRGL